MSTRLRAFIGIIIMIVPGFVIVKWQLDPAPITALELLIVMIGCITCIMLVPEGFPMIYTPKKWVEDTVNKWCPEEKDK